jgi:hypothetical protein
MPANEESRAALQGDAARELRVGASTDSAAYHWISYPLVVLKKLPQGPAGSRYHAW